MPKLARLLCLGLLAAAAVPGAASAQWYPPPGYYPPPPPPGYYSRPYGAGYHCDAWFRAPWGSRRLVCNLVEPKPLGAGCHCEAPLPPPGYAPRPDPWGRVIP